MKLTPSSTARRRMAIALFRSFGGPQIPSPVRRIAPYPRRLTETCPPREIVPASLAEMLFVPITPPTYLYVGFCVTWLIQRLHCESLGIACDHNFAGSRNSGNPNAIQNFIGYTFRVPRSQNKVDLPPLIGNENERTPRRHAQLGAESVIVGVAVTGEITISITEFPAQAHALACYRISGKQVDVSLLGQLLRLCQIGDETPYLIEWQAVQIVPVAKLKRTQSHYGNQDD